MLEQGMMGGKEVGWDALRERLGLRGVVGKEWCDDGDGEEWCDVGDGEDWDDSCVIRIDEDGILGDTRVANGMDVLRESWIREDGVTLRDTRDVYKYLDAEMIRVVLDDDCIREGWTPDIRLNRDNTDFEGRNGTSAGIVNSL